MLVQNDVANFDGVCKYTVFPSFLSTMQVSSCLPGVLLLSRKGSATYDELSYPNLSLINEHFNAVAPQVFKKDDRVLHPLMELAIMINQLFGLTYFSDLTMLGHLVAVSFGVSAKMLLGLPHKELRARLTNLEHLRDVFFAEKFNFFKFEKPRQESMRDMTLN